jgi:hypothetical protein
VLSGQFLVGLVLLTSAMQLVRGLGDLATLVAGALQFVCSGLTRAIGAGDRCGTIGRTAGNFRKASSARVAIVEADNHHFATVRNIATAWVLTLPASMLISGVLYWVFLQIM